MNFETLFKKISPRLKRIARNYNHRCSFVDEEDFYQEMCIQLWNNFRGGVPVDKSENYVVRGCELHLLNYLRKVNGQGKPLSLEEPLDEEGNTLKDILPDGEESVAEYVERNITIGRIKNNGFSKREKEVFSLLLDGWTVREIGQQLGISHVMVVKLKRKIIEKCQNSFQCR